MGEILGLGVSHYPAFSGLDEQMAGVFQWALGDPDLPAHLRDPAGWPEQVRAEWAEDRGLAAARAHRADMERGFRRVRAELDEFRPDFVLIFGDDQYENFHEDVIPPFTVLAYEDLEVYPWRHAAESGAMQDRPNVWGEGADVGRLVRGHRAGALDLVEGLLARDFDIAYAYQPLHHPGLGHAFLNVVLYLDLDRDGFDYPVVPMALNTYGRRVVATRGFLARLGEKPKLDPPSPSPTRLFALGRALAQVILASPWRVAVVASSSWSHAFLCDATYHLHPDHTADRRLYEAMVTADWDTWRGTPLAAVEHAGQQELLNWFPLAGAMAELNLKPSWAQWAPSWIFNSNKVFTAFPPAGDAAS